MIFLACFLGALFALVTALLLVYTYVMLRLLPRLKRGFIAFVEEVGPRAVFERANLDPVEAMRMVGLGPADAAAKIAKEHAGTSSGGTILYTCEDHGRCDGCPKVLAQFEAIIRCQGEASFDAIEKQCYAQLKAQIASDMRLDGESEIDRQKRIAKRVVEALVREGCTASLAHSVVWSRGKEDRATFAGWLSAARAGCEKMVITDEDEEGAA